MISPEDFPTVAFVFFITNSPPTVSVEIELITQSLTEWVTVTLN